MENHLRLSEERTSIDDLRSKADWLENVEWSLDDNSCIRIIFDIRLDHDTFNLQLTYPNTFPSSVPNITPTCKIRLSEHQYGNGDLCLEIRPDNWRTEFTGADMIQSAFNLLDTERPGVDGTSTTAPSAHDVPEAISIRHEISRFYISPEHLAVITTEAHRGLTATLWALWTNESFIVTHIKSLEANDWSWVNTSVPTALKENTLPRKAVVIKTEKKKSAFGKVSKTEDLGNILGNHQELTKTSYHCIVITADNEVLLFHQIEEVKGLIRYRTIIAPNENQRRSGEEYAEVDKVRIGIVGLGSLGSKIAVSLARVGIGRFDLIDGDILHPGNLERHDADWRDIGAHKVDAAKQRMTLVSPNIEISARRVSIGAQVSATEASNVNGALDNCDLIIDATANPNVFNHLAGITTASRKTLVWGAIYAGGIGGYIARSRPDKDAGPFLIRQALNEFYETIDESPPTTDREGYDGRRGDEVFIATDSEVSVIANHMTNFALDALLAREPSYYQDAVYFIGLKREWAFEGPFHVQPISVTASNHGKQKTGKWDPVQAEFLGELLDLKRNEIENRRKNS
ncbi:molybdopterin-synthase adenylyltransferase [Rhodobiaceae bacterium]|nr:molybdopterin-synthase adenylyltransferase [Rhodobiaceae bacterium]